MLYNGRVDDIPYELEEKMGLLDKKSKSNNLFGITTKETRFAWLEMDNISVGNNPEWNVEELIEAVDLYGFFPDVFPNVVYPFDILIDADFQKCHCGPKLLYLRKILFDCNVLNESDRQVLINMPGLDRRIMYLKTSELLGNLDVIKAYHIEYLWQLFFCEEGTIYDLISEIKQKGIDYSMRLLSLNVFLDIENRTVRCFTPMEALEYEKLQVIESKKIFKSINKKLKSIIDNSRSLNQTCFEDHNRSLESQIEENDKWINKFTSRITEINKKIKSQKELEKTR